jgi:hypothetical protein
MSQYSINIFSYLVGLLYWYHLVQDVDPFSPAYACCTLYLGRLSLLGQLVVCQYIQSFSEVHQ